MSVLKTIDTEMNALNINYEFAEWTDKPAYPYVVGEYQEVESLNEDGEQETQFIMTVWARGITATEDLENVKNKIKKHFPKVGGRLAITDEGSRVAIFYANTLGNLPTGDAELKKIQVNLLVKEWSE